jgi:hypothetical protein
MRLSLTENLQSANPEIHIAGMVASLTESEPGALG